LHEDEAVQKLSKMGVRAETVSGRITAYPPVYRNDFLHPVDVVEDLMIGYGMDAFPSEPPQDFTVGRLTGSEIFSREVKTLLVGMGYQEMIFNYLGSRRDFIDNMYPDDQRAVATGDCVRIANPMSENFEFVRPSIIPQLLGAESVSAHAVYPHYIFEVGKVAVRDTTNNYGSRTVTALGAVVADAEAGFNLVSSQAAALFFYLGLEYEPSVVDDPRFLAGRVAALLVKGQRVGVLGEIHPQVLENWGVTVPCAVIELDLDLLRTAGDLD
ncbi:MAG: phenylalanine--tRNA ligase subunit beta, partial [Spirochaetia bacterium]